MADIEMERRRKNNTWMWIVAAVLVVVIAVGAWLLFANGTTAFNGSPAADTPGATQPYDDPATAPDRQPTTVPEDSPRP